MKACAVILGGGSGSRMGAKQNKIFLPLRGVPAIVRAAAPFTGLCAEAVVVARPEEQGEMTALLRRYGLDSFVKKVVPGGSTRQESVRHGLDALPDETMKKRVRHVVTEIERVRSFVRAFANGDIEAAGRLFNASHDSLAADYEVTVPELDVAVDVARKNGAYGARMTGGGFGGSIIALVDKGRSQEVAQKIADEFEKQGFHAPRALAAYAAKSASREA